MKKPLLFLLLVSLALLPAMPACADWDMTQSLWQRFPFLSFTPRGNSGGVLFSISEMGRDVFYTQFQTIETDRISVGEEELQKPPDPEEGGCGTGIGAAALAAVPGILYIDRRKRRNQS